MTYTGRVVASHKSRLRDGWRIAIQTDDGLIHLYTRQGSPLNEPRGAKAYSHGTTVVVEATQVGQRTALAIDTIKVA